MNPVDDYDGVAMEQESMIQVPQTQQLAPEKTEAEREIEARKEEVKPLTVEIANKKAILRHVKPQESKYWHFRFIDPRHTSQMTQVLQNIQGYRLSVEYGVRLNTADIILKMNYNSESLDNSQGEIVGKVHLLLCDKRDANLPSKYYCKLFFFHFKNSQLFQAVKTALVNFFENFKASQKRIRDVSIANKHGRVTRRLQKYSLRPRKTNHTNKHRRATRRPRQ